MAAHRGRLIASQQPVEVVLGGALVVRQYFRNAGHRRRLAYRWSALVDRYSGIETGGGRCCGAVEIGPPLSAVVAVAVAVVVRPPVILPSPLSPLHGPVCTARPTTTVRVTH